MSISTTTLKNLNSIIAAIVSSRGLNSVGPKQTPKFLTVIRLFFSLSETLKLLKISSKTKKSFVKRKSN